MLLEQPLSPDAVDLVQRTLKTPLKPGEIGVLLAGAGTGKTACLTHIALENLLRGNPVLHVCFGEVPDKIKAWYHELLSNLIPSHSAPDVARQQHMIEPLRLILSYLHQTFDPGKLDSSLHTLEQQAGFRPSVVIMDGLDPEMISRESIEKLREFASRHGVSLWMSARTNGRSANERGIPFPCDVTDDLFEAILYLDATPNVIQVKVLKHEGKYSPERPEVKIDPVTFLLV